MSILIFGSAGDSRAACSPPNTAAGETHTCSTAGGDIVDFTAGAGDDTVNIISGNITGTLSGGADNDTINITGGTTNRVNGQTEDDTINMMDGGVGQIDGGSGNDEINVTGGTVGGIDGGNNADTINLSGGVITGTVLGGTGLDTVNVTGTANLDGVTHLLGGGGLSDALTFDGWSGSIQNTAINEWESIDIVNDSVVDLGPMTGGIQAPGGTITLDASSMIIGGGGGVTDVLMGNFVAMEMVVNGAIDLRQDSIGDLLGITADISGTGDFMLDVQFDELIANGGTGGSDVVFVAGGNAVQPGTEISLHVNPLFGGNGYTMDLIPLVALVGGSTSPDDAFVLEGDGLFGNYFYDLIYDDGLGWFALENQGIHSDLAGYAVPLSGAQFLWHDSVGTLRERLGGVRAGGGPNMANLGQTASADTTVNLADASGRHRGTTAPGVWIRGFGGHAEVDDNDGVDFDQENYGGQIGADIGFEVSGDGDQIRIGAFAGYSEAEIDMHDGVGNADIDGFTLGGYATYLSPYGFYVDLVVAGQWLDFDTQIDSTGTDASYDGGTIGGSLEVGYHVSLDGFFVEPQAQLSYVNVSHESFSDSFGSSIDDESSDSLRGRFSVRGGPEIMLDNGGYVLPYVEVGVIHEFEGKNEIQVDMSEFESDVSGTIFEVGLGVMADLGENVSVNADVDFGFGENVDTIQGVLGLRVSW